MYYFILMFDYINMDLKEEEYYILNDIDNNKTILLNDLNNWDINKIKIISDLEKFKLLKIQKSDYYWKTFADIRLTVEWQYYLNRFNNKK